MAKRLQLLSPLKGEPGKSAYAYAKEAGYTGTEEEFAEKLSTDFSEVIIDSALTIPGAAADAKAVGDHLTNVKKYMYSMEKVAKFVTTEEALVEVDTDTKKVKVNACLMYYRDGRTTIPETTVSIDQTSALSYVVWNTAEVSVRSIAPSAFDGTSMFVIAILSRDYPTNINYNYVPGPYDVNGYLYNAPVSQPVYVSTDGSDAWNAIGDRIHPFRTIGKAIASGAKTIIVFAGTYREPVSLSRTGDEFELLCKPVYQTDGPVLDKVVIDLSAQLDMVADSTTGLVKAAYASTDEDFIHKVFVGRTEALVCNDTFIEKGYTCNLWLGNTKLRPVLSLAECQATTWTWFYDGANVYANADPGAYCLNDGSVDYGVSLSYFRKVKLLGIEVRHAKSDGVKLLNCSDAEITDCVFGYTGVRTGLALENTSAIVRGCEAMFNRTDGLNIHGTGVADFIDCRSHDNGDDGISHHDKSSGTVIGGEYYNNGKGGVCSPTFGSRNGVNGAEIHHNGVGVYAVADSNVASYPDSSVSNCVIRDNGVGIKTQYYKLKCWGNVLEGNDTDVVEEYGGIVEIVRDSIPAPATAQVGQTIVVKEVDESGKPVSWECADLAGGGGSGGGSVDPEAVGQIVEAYLAENPPSGLEPTTDSTEQASYGGELATSNGWTSAGWTGTFASGFTHTSGNTSPLIFAMPEDTGTNIYRVSFKCSASIAVQAIMVRCGNSTLFDLYGQAADPIVLGIQSVSNGDVEFVPASDFTGTISEISIKRVLSDFESVHTMIDSNGDTSFEIRATKASQGNLFVGKNSGRQNVSGYGCVALGANALENNTSGFWNSALGKDCLLHNTAGSRNIAIGYNSLRDNEVGQRNIAIGTFTMTQMKAGNWNIAIGADSMNVSTGGNKNTAVGFNTLTHNESDNNVAFGADVLAQNTTGGNNTAIGARAMTANTSGADSVAIGSGALQKNTSGSWNTAVGNTALYNLTTGQKNVAIGTGAGKSLTTGKRCIAIGQFADLNATEDDQLNIGNVIKGSLDTTSPYVSIDGGLRLPIIPTTYSGDDPVVWNNGGVLMIGTGGMDTIIQEVIDALPVYNGEVE